MKKIVFIDNIGRTILAQEISRSETQLVVKDPAMIHVNQTQNGQLQVQLIPLFFREFLSASSQVTGTSWSYNLSQISLAVGDLEVEAKLNEQYDRVFTQSLIIPPSDPQIIKLFED